MSSTTQKTPTTPPLVADESAASGEMRIKIILSVLFLLALGVFIARLYVGSSSVGFPTGQSAGTIFKLRVTRLAIGVIVGIALATSGVALQALLRNPLAEPYILGLSTGAGLGMMIQALFTYATGIIIISNKFGDSFGALIGAAISMFIVFLAGRRRGMIDPLGLLLTGVVLSTINGALIMLVHYILGPGGLREDIARWMMGYINEGISIELVYAMGGLTLLGLCALNLSARSMDIATLSDTEAISLGVSVHRLRMILFLVASCLAAGAVALAGPIAFVGLICPHIIRTLIGPSHKWLITGSAMAGATLVVGADTLSALISHLSLELFHWRIGLLPIGIFTAILGGPVFLWILRPQLGKSDA
ncbi:FecCD family ABC transporter permease [Poriferisphaera sp. WC338]|uniref:FecCD family ABC transporter permease n=1 Tax=Poriferisphaera sp. WC338 TaxID=3425129 RepID=UPI003D81BC0E